MAKTGSQVHAILACVKFINQQGRPIRSKELIALWPKIGISTLPALMGTLRVHDSKGKLRPPRPKFLERVGVGKYRITKLGEQELKRFGAYVPSMWNPECITLPWEQAAAHGSIQPTITTPKPMETGVAVQFMAGGFIPELLEANHYENAMTKCKNPACGVNRQDVTRYYQRPEVGDRAVLCATIHTCRLCTNQYLAELKDVAVEDLPELDYKNEN